MSGPCELSLSEIRNFMLTKGGKVTNHELVKYFKKFLTNPNTQGKPKTSDCAIFMQIIVNVFMIESCTTHQHNQNRFMRHDIRKYCFVKQLVACYRFVYDLIHWIAYGRNA